VTTEVWIIIYVSQMGEIFKGHTLQIPVAVLFKASSVFINISFVTYDKKEREPAAK